MLRISEPGSSEPTVAMTCSNAIKINDTDTPYLALLVYMMLSADDAHSSLAATPDVRLPEGSNVLDELESESEERARRASEEAVYNTVIPSE